MESRVLKASGKLSLIIDVNLLSLILDVAHFLSFCHSYSNLSKVMVTAMCLMGTHSRAGLDVNREFVKDGSSILTTRGRRCLIKNFKCLVSLLRPRTFL